MISESAASSNPVTSSLTTCILGLVDLPGVITGGDILWNGESLSWQRRKGPGPGGPWQRDIHGLPEPHDVVQSALHDRCTDPEVLKYHLGMNKKQGTERVTELLSLVGMSNPKQRIDQYPHEFSGGMRQRAMIAIGTGIRTEATHR